MNWHQSHTSQSNTTKTLWKISLPIRHIFILYFKWHQFWKRLEVEFFLRHLHTENKKLKLLVYIMNYWFTSWYAYKKDTHEYIGFHNHRVPQSKSVVPKQFLATAHHLKSNDAAGLLIILLTNVKWLQLIWLIDRSHHCESFKTTNLSPFLSQWCGWLSVLSNLRHVWRRGTRNILHYNMIVCILARNDYNFSMAAGLIRVHMPGVK